jgi:hypothetical protein
MHTRTARRCGADLRRVTMWWPPMCAGSRLSRAVGIVMRWLADGAADVVVLRFNGFDPASSLAASNHSGHLLVEPLVARTELPCNEVRHCTPPACRGTDGTRAVYRDRRVGKHPLSPVRPRPRPPRPRQRPDLAIQPEQRGLHVGAEGDRLHPSRCVANAQIELHENRPVRTVGPGQPHPCTTAHPAMGQQPPNCTGYPIDLCWRNHSAADQDNLTPLANRLPVWCHIS